MRLDRVGRALGDAKKKTQTQTQTASFKKSTQCGLYLGQVQATCLPVPGRG